MLVQSAAQQRQMPLWALREEFGLVKQAFYTDPGDQSPWLYHRWLLGCLLAHVKAGSDTKVSLAFLPELPPLFLC